MLTRESRAEERQATAAPVLEVFASIQGEGLFVGEPQVFVRLRGCPLRCRWCDTPGSWDVPEEPRTRIAAGFANGAAARREPGWATPFQAACWVAELDPEARRAVSLTGGEPLVWPPFVGEFRALLGGRRLHLETAGHDPAALKRVLPAVDHVSLDLKLPQDLDAPQPLAGAAAAESALPHGAKAWAAVREANLRLLAGRDAALKIIVAGGRAVADFEPLLDDVARLAPDLILVLQPVTPAGGVAAPAAGLLTELAGRALELGLRPRVLPQIHRVLGLP